MLAVNIDNPELEKRFKEYAKNEKRSLEDIISNALKLFIENKENFSYSKKDPMKFLVKQDFNSDDEDLSDVKLFSNIEDSSEYISSLRRKNRL